MFAEVEPSPWREDTQTSMTALAGSTVQLFNFKGAEVRLVQIEGNPWFVASDVTRALGMDVNQTGNYLRCMDDGEKQKAHRSTLNLFKGKGPALYNIISESGLYKLVMRSDKPVAKSFQDWSPRWFSRRSARTGREHRQQVNVW